MNKYLPFVLIGIAILGGFLLKTSLEGNSEKSTVTENSSNKIDNHFDTLLIYPKKRQIANFTLLDHFSTKFNNEQFIGFWNLIFSGYTNCPDVCPNILNQMTQLYQLMNKETRKKFQFIFLSVDPERDTPDHLKKYLDYFHQDFIGITGDKSQIDILIKSLGGIYSINKDEGEFYTVDHSARIFIVGPNGERVGILSGGVIKAIDKSQLVSDLTALSR